MIIKILKRLKKNLEKIGKAKNIVLIVEMVILAICIIMTYVFKERSYLYLAIVIAVLILLDIVPRKE